MLMTQNVGTSSALDLVAESSDYPLLLSGMTIDIRNYGSSSAERLLSADTYYLPGLMWGKGAFAIVGTIVGSILLRVSRNGTFTLYTTASNIDDLRR